MSAEQQALDALKCVVVDVWGDDEDEDEDPQSLTHTKCLEAIKRLEKQIKEQRDG